MDLKLIKEDLNEFCSSKGWHLFEVSYNHKDNAIEVLLDDKFDLDQLENVSNEISSYMDKYDNDIEGNYVLDVSTVGVERPIRNQEELKEAIGQYIYAKTKDDEVYGYLNKFENDVLSIAYKEKTVDKIKNIEYSKLKKVRYAVKF